MQAELSFTAARERRDRGMSLAAEHADAETPKWTDHAFALFQLFILTEPEPFLAERFVTWSKDRIEQPPDPRAWGSVVTKAKRRNLITRVGYAIGAVNLSPKPLWQRVGA